MLSERKKKILKLIIDEFNENANPVGSKALINKYNIPYSSATIRNEMLNLEGKGLLQKTHTSSGRIPSEDGYRFYIEDLLQFYNQTGKYLLHKDHYFDEKYKLFEKLIKILMLDNCRHIDRAEDVINIVSAITNCLVFYIGPENENIIVDSINYNYISDSEVLVTLIDNIGRINSKIFHIASPVEYLLFSKLIKYSNELLKYKPLSELNSRFAIIIDSLFMYLGKYCEICDQLSKFFNKIEKTHLVSICGEKNLFYCHDCEKTYKILEFLEDPNNIKKLLNSRKEAINVQIGDKILFKELKQFTIISLTLEMQKNNLITFGIIGAKRMSYNDILQLLLFIKDNYRR